MKSKEQKRIINEDITDIKYLIKVYKLLGKYNKVAELEKELKRLEGK